MLRQLLVLYWIAAASCVLQVRCNAQSESGTDKAKVYVAFRIENWKAKHINDPAQAEEHAKTLRTLGCEVKTNPHNGHTDVQCRTVFWKTLTVDTHEKAHQWIDWLHTAGFDTIHGHKVGTHTNPQTAGQREVVQYRSADWRAKHIHKSQELNQLLALYRGLGVEVEMSQHNGHTDVKARCPEWMEIQLPNHKAADAWQAFLNEAGFETKHVH